jgi:hypothetical protein
MLLARLRGRTPDHGDGRGADRHVSGAAAARRATHSSYVYLGRLRKILGADRPVHCSTGSPFDVGPERIDVHLLRNMVGPSRRTGCADADQVALLRQGVALWRGRPLADRCGDGADRTRRLWQQEHLEAVAAWVAAELAAGRGAR